MCLYTIARSHTMNLLLFCYSSPFVCHIYLHINGTHSIPCGKIWFWLSLIFLIESTEKNCCTHPQIHNARTKIKEEPKSVQIVTFFLFFSPLPLISSCFVHEMILICHVSMSCLTTFGAPIYKNELIFSSGEV